MNVGPQQARLLAAMGLEPMRLRDPGETLRRDPPVAAAARAATPARALPGAPPTASVRPPPLPQAPGAARTAATPSRPGALLDALRRAAGGRDVGELAADLDRIRREPSLKRALWPRLRALRRH